MQKMPEDVICQVCGSDMWRDPGLHSDGDGDMYERWECLVCGEVQRENEVWIDNDGGVHRTEHEMWEAMVMPVGGDDEILFLRGLLWKVEVIEFEDGTLEAEIKPLEYTCDEYQEIPW